jgi:hypothetical protein
VDAWELCIDTIESSVTAALLLALRWAAIVRARAHVHTLRPHRRRKANERQRPPVDRNVAAWVVWECR